MQTIKDFKPFEFQQKTINSAISALDRCGGVCIFDETGLGKTITGAHIAINAGKTILIVSPKANQSSWSKILPEATICTRQKIADGEFDVIVVDEAHNFNNPKNKSFRALIETIYFRGDKFPKVILLTATPINNNIEEFINMLKLIPFRLDSIPFYTVAISGHRCIVSEKDLKKVERFDVDAETGIGKTFKQIGKHVEAQFALEQAFTELGACLKEFCFRTTRAEIAENFSKDIELMGHFPKISVKNIDLAIFGLEIQQTIKILEKLPLAFYNLDKYIGQPSQTGLSGIIRTFLMKRLDSSILAFTESIENILNTQLNIFTSGVVEVDGEKIEVDGEFWSDLKQDIEGLEKIKTLWENKEDGEKIDLLKQIIDSHPKEKIVIFTEYTATQKVLAKALEGYKVLQYNGSSEDKLLDTIASEFDRNSLSPSNKYQILLTTDALAEGVNLHTANILIHYDLKWNPSRMIQREGRVNRLVRIGLTPNPVTVYTFGVDQIVETIVKLERRLATKTNMANLILNSKDKIELAQNVNHYSYYESSIFEKYIGIKFPSGTLFFRYSQLRENAITTVKISNLPTVKAKKEQKRPKAWFNSLFRYRTNIGYHWHVSNIENYFNITDDNLLKLYCIFRNHLYGWLFLLDGKKDEVKVLYKKFQGEIPEACDFSSYSGDECLDGEIVFE